MKKPIAAIATVLIAVSLLISSCTKPPIIPGAAGGGTGGGGNTNRGTATITFDGSDMLSVDSIHWDRYTSSIYRIQAFKSGTAPFTLYVSSIVSGTRSIPYSNLYWLHSGTTHTSSSGTVLITNNNNVLSGSFTASSTTSTTISVTYSNVRELGQ